MDASAPGLDLTLNLRYSITAGIPETSQLCLKFTTFLKLYTSEYSPQQVQHLWLVSLRQHQTPVSEDHYSLQTLHI